MLYIRPMKYLILIFGALGTAIPVDGQETRTISSSEWILPDDERSPSVWGIRDGIVFSLWPHSVERIPDDSGGGPRGLIRVGYDFDGMTYLINFIAIEPVVDGEMEFSEISPSRVDGEVGKLMWANDDAEAGRFRPFAGDAGTISRPDPNDQSVEQLTVYVFIEQFLSGAHPYLKLTIRSDRPDELGLQIFHHDDSAKMERCALTATMGNYSRLRRLYLRDRVVDARDLYNGYDGIHFVEKDGFSIGELARGEAGDFIAVVSPSESFAELAAWPQTPKHYGKRWWRYRPFFMLSQYWRKLAEDADSSLHVRVNGRAHYYSGFNPDSTIYVDIPGGVAYENFEMREDYREGQQFYFGLTRREPEELIAPGHLPD